MFDQREMTTTINRKELVEKLRQNRESHKEIVQEARTGYLKKAKEAIQERLDKLESGEIVSLAFDLHPPLDNTESYDVAIEMYELHTEDTVTLTTTQFRELWLDKWTWKHSFLLTNASYSKKASDTVGASRF